MKILKGNLVSAPTLGKLEIVEHGCLVSAAVPRPA